MKVKITGATVSKKGYIWLQALVVEGETPKIGETFECSPCEAVEEKPTTVEAVEVLETKN